MNTQPSQEPKAPIRKDDEIDLLELAKVVWNGRRTILKFSLLAGILGVIIALLTPKEYTATTKMVPQTSSESSKLGGLASLAAIAGFNLDNAVSGETLSPMVYPEIVSSVTFQMDLMNIPFSFAEVNHPVSLYEYYSKISKPSIFALIGKYTIGLPGVIISAIKSESDQKTSLETKGPIALTPKQEAVRKIIASRVTLDLDMKQGIITLQSAFPEALLSAQVADQARELLQKYITRFKIEKASDKLLFIEQRYQENKKEFEKAQERLARFRDQNKNVSSMMARTEEDRLQSDYSITMTVYNELSKQLEQAKIQVKEETPVFSILEPAVVPNEKSKPKKGKIVVISLFIGAILGIGKIFGEIILKDVKIK